jgi:hypothetical protein
MKRRIGDKTFPSAVLLDQHVSWTNLHYLEVQGSTWVLTVKLDTCRATITNLLAWLAWLQSMETFNIRWDGIQVTNPPDGPQQGLPTGMGVIQVNLPLQTKSSESRTADVVIAYETGPGKKSRLVVGDFMGFAPVSSTCSTFLYYVPCYGHSLDVPLLPLQLRIPSVGRTTYPWRSLPGKV